MKNAIDAIKAAAADTTFRSRRDSGIYLAEVARVAALTGIVLFCALCAGLAPEPPQAHAASAISLSKAKVTLACDSFTYTGGAFNPLPTVKYGSKTLKKGTDYTVSYSSGRKDVGTYKVTVTGKKSYKGTKSVSFKIKPAAMSAASASVGGSITYTGAAQAPVPSVSYKGVGLKSGADFTASYTNNTNAGTGRITLAGKGNFSGSKIVEFKINPAPMSSVSVCQTNPARLTYTASAQTPAVGGVFRGMTLQNGTDFTVSYSNNVNAGTGRATLIGRGNYTGSNTVEFTINPASISTASSKFTLGTSGIAPFITWGGQSLALGRDYTVSYSLQSSGTKLVASIVGTGNFTGSTSAELALVR